MQPPEVRRARSFHEAVSLGRDHRSARKLVMACQGEIDFLTPAAYVDHVLPHMVSETQEEYARCWRALVERVRAASDIDQLVADLHSYVCD